MRAGTEAGTRHKLEAASTLPPLFVAHRRSSTAGLEVGAGAGRGLDGGWARRWRREQEAGRRALSQKLRPCAWVWDPAHPPERRRGGGGRARGGSRPT